MLVAGVQMACRVDKTANLEKAEYYIRQAAARGARLVALQELFGTHFFPASVDAANFRLAESDDGQTMSLVCELARSLGVWIAAGLFERDRGISGRFFNSQLIVAPSGEIAGRYRKTFIPLRRRNSERYYFTPGNLGVPVFQVEELRVAFNICYDRHFPELARIAALQGAHLLVYPTAALADVGRVNTWQAEMISRAGENVFYVMGVGRCGMEDERKYSGQSMIVDPCGTVLASLGGEEEGLVVADVSAAAVEEARIDYAHLRDLRADVYRRLLKLSEPEHLGIVAAREHKGAFASKKVVDLSRTLGGTDHLEVPGLGFGAVDYRLIHTHEQHGRTNADLKFNIHEGTHIDPPYHFIENGATIDEIPLETLIAPGFVFRLKNVTPGAPIPLKEVLASATPPDDLKGYIVIIDSGWGKQAASGVEYYSKAPYLSQELADWLVQKRVRGVGLVNPPDTVDPPPRAGDAPIHRTLLANDVLIIENLTNLDAITTKEFTVIALPLKIARGCGGPTRVVAVLNGGFRR